MTYVSPQAFRFAPHIYVPILKTPSLMPFIRYLGTISQVKLIILGLQE